MPTPNILLDLIWGNDAETQVFAHAHNPNGTSLTFRITQDASRPQSFANRIVVRFHDLPVSCSSETFPDRQCMRNALGDAIREAWSSCVHAAAAVDAVVDLYDDDVGEGTQFEGVDGNMKWRIRYESLLYHQYLDALLPVQAFFPEPQTPSKEPIKHIDIKDIILIDRLPGRGTSSLVRISSSPTPLHVLRAIEFTDILNSQAELTYNRNSFYRSIKVSSSIPPHPNIQPPPRMLLTTQHRGIPMLRGTLYPFMARGTLDTQVMTSQEHGTRLSLHDKARWCLQMCEATAHAHRVAKTFHMDIKPANFLVDDNGNAVLIDWEQSGAPWYTLAPEANGEWDVAEVVQADGYASQLVYTKYQGPERVNLPRGRPAWNVFSEWSERWPEACEAAEVFSLGRTMWMLLQQVPQDDIWHLSPDELHVSWAEDAADIPDAWKAVVMQCLEEDPRTRIGLSDLVKFWEQQQDIVD